MNLFSVLSFVTTVLCQEVSLPFPGRIGEPFSAQPPRLIPEAVEQFRNAEAALRQQALAGSRNILGQPSDRLNLAEIIWPSGFQRVLREQAGLRE